MTNWPSLSSPARTAQVSILTAVLGCARRINSVTDSTGHTTSRNRWTGPDPFGTGGTGLDRFGAGGADDFLLLVLLWLCVLAAVPSESTMPGRPLKMRLRPFHTQDPCLARLTKTKACAFESGACDSFTTSTMAVVNTLNLPYSSPLTTSIMGKLQTSSSL